MTLGSFILIALFVWFAWVLARDIGGRRTSGGTKPGARTRGAYLLKARPAPELAVMPESTSRFFTYQDERHAAAARQRLWMRYEDREGHVTERTVEIYHPENDEVIFAWCRLKREPRTFARRSIQRWQLLPERFEFDPVVDQYWDEEGTRDMSEKLPWRRWLSMQPDHIAKRYGQQW